MGGSLFDMVNLLVSFEEYTQHKGHTFLKLPTLGEIALCLSIAILVLIWGHARNAK
jgi:hypothetical protein